MVSSVISWSPKKISSVKGGWKKTPFMTTDTQDALASLRQWQLSKTTQADSGFTGINMGRFIICTHIPKNTAPQSQKDALERWSQRAGSVLERDIACNCGTIAHEHCEYVLKTAASWLDRALTRRVHGRSGMMDWLDLLRQSPAGHSRKRRRVHQCGVASP